MASSVPSKLRIAPALDATGCLQCRNRNSLCSSDNLQVRKKTARSLGLGRAAAPAPAPAPAPVKEIRRLYPGEADGFVQEMRFVAMKLHRPSNKDDKDEQNVGSWEATLEGYVKYLVDSKVVFDCVEGIVERAVHPWYFIRRIFCVDDCNSTLLQGFYHDIDSFNCGCSFTHPYDSEFRNTGLERSEKLTKDLKWFSEQGCEVSETSSPGKSYSQYLEELAENNPPAFICHFYNIYFAHIAGGQMIGRQVASKVLDGKELEFYKWDGDLPQMLKNMKEKLNKVAEDWSRQQKNHCLQETAKSFKYSGNIIRLIIL